MRNLRYDGPAHRLRYFRASGGECMVMRGEEFDASNEDAERLLAQPGLGVVDVNEPEPPSSGDEPEAQSGEGHDKNEED